MMPRLNITTVDDDRIVLTDGARLKAEMDRYDAAIEALIPALAGDDDEAGQAAARRYRVLSLNYRAILDQLDAWNTVVEKENREARLALAAKLKARRQS
jgi:hypothetical protein